MPYFKDLRDWIGELEAKEKLHRITRPMDKDKELMPLVRWQFRGLGEEERKAFLFEHVVRDGNECGGQLLVACYAASRQIYALGMRCKPEEIYEKWISAQMRPIPPGIVAAGPCQEEVHMGRSLLEHGGLEEIPIPISTPGFDNAPYLTAPHFITRDPETGIYNIGVYRSMVKSPLRMGANAVENQHLSIHRRRYLEKGQKKMPAAVALGVLPSLAFCGVSSLPYGVSEYDVAGGIAGEPLDLVRCKTSDLLVPAHAEIVIEGEIDTEWLERDGSFGEYTGYIGRFKMTPFIDVTCITHRRNPIHSCFLSQFPPSESSKLRQIGSEGVYLKYLKYDANVPAVLDVAFHETGGSWQFCVVRLKKSHPSEPWQALHATASLNPLLGKIAIAVDEDIDPWDADSVNWALSFRLQPHRDVEIIRGRVTGLDPSGAPSTSPDARYPNPPHGGSAILMDATRKFPYPPVALPEKTFMERARAIWEELGLPPLKPKVPWCGYELGHWTEEEREEAELALRGEHYRTGEKLGKQRIKG
jgi:UbiD family decarboxylase